MDDYLKEFYDKICIEIKKSRLEHTDCELAAMPINKKFLEQYKRGFI